LSSRIDKYTSSPTAQKLTKAGTLQINNSNTTAAQPQPISLLTNNLQDVRQQKDSTSPMTSMYTNPTATASVAMTNTNQPQQQQGGQKFAPDQTSDINAISRTNTWSNLQSPVIGSLESGLRELHMNSQEPRVWPGMISRVRTKTDEEQIQGRNEDVEDGDGV